MDGNHVCFFPPFSLAIEADVGARNDPDFRVFEVSTPRLQRTTRSVAACVLPARSESAISPSPSAWAISSPRPRAPTAYAPHLCRRPAECGFTNPALCVAGPSANYRADIRSYGFGGRGAPRGARLSRRP